MAEATVYIHGGDYDCSELVRMCYAAVGVLPKDSYMWTGNEVSLLKAHGFQTASLNSPQMGDVLWRSGHTEIFLGSGIIGGARHGDYAGGLDGRKGDQDGTEVTKGAYRASAWSLLLRYKGSKTVDGIPAAIAAALVADHIIEHDAHGYSQPHRMGDGTTEAVQISWDGAWEAFDVTQAVKFLKEMPIRTKPELSASKVGTYKRSETCVLDGMVFNDGRVWGTYIGATSGKRRYVCIASADGRVAAC